MTPNDYWFGWLALEIVRPIVGALVLYLVVTKPIVAAISRHLDYWKGQ